MDSSSKEGVWPEATITPPTHGAQHPVSTLGVQNAQLPTVTQPVFHSVTPQHVMSGQQVYSSYHYPTPMPIKQAPEAQMSVVAATTPRAVTFSSTHSMYPSELACHGRQPQSYGSPTPIPSAAAPLLVPDDVVPSSGVTVDHMAINQPHFQTPAHASRASDLVGSPPSATLPSLYTYPSVPPAQTTARAMSKTGPSMTPYSGFMQTHQVKNVQVFTGNPDCKVLVEDWVRDMQYLLEAIELPPHLRFSTVVRHLGGEARKLVLNLPPHDQTPEKAFEELRAEYSDTRGSLDPLADFYERSQNPGESACSYAIALEAKLRDVEEKQRGGRQFPDRDSKLTRQFMRGLSEEDVYIRIAPMIPRLLRFRELQAELRHLAREAKKFQPQNKMKKTLTQVHVATDGTAGGGKSTSEMSELLEMVKRLANSQEEQMAKLLHLEKRVSFQAVEPRPTFPSSRGRGIPNAGFTCYRCEKPGHTARYCRAVLPDPKPEDSPQLSTPAEGLNPYPALPLNA